VSPWDTETRIVVGAALKAGDRLLYPVHKVEVVRSEGHFLGLRIIPQAILVVEPGGDYLISLGQEAAGAEEQAEIAPFLEGIVEEAKRRRNINK
jgi:uncharacterized spore protein YtfJ